MFKFFATWKPKMFKYTNHDKLFVKMKYQEEKPAIFCTVYVSVIKCCILRFCFVIQMGWIYFSIEGNLTSRVMFRWLTHLTNLMFMFFISLYSLLAYISDIHMFQYCFNWKCWTVLIYDLLFGWLFNCNFFFTLILLRSSQHFWLVLILL